ncbi:MAG: hypothetical protein DHS20C17_21420 [Cyclobacteriaceae bacterium]|nr:MAG: hypothetical protein DHS20C17_21420 [Cyclobacteriaceae bacterium]
MEDAGFLSLFISEQIYLVDQKPRLIESKLDESKLDESNTSDKHLIVTPSNLTEPDREFLFKIFASVNVNSEDLELTNEERDLQQYSSAFFFGIKPAKQPLKLYQKSLVDGCPVVFADNLQDIAVDQQKKKKLWEALKSCF